MNANWLAAMLAFAFFVFITVRGELVDYAGILGFGPKKDAVDKSTKVKTLKK